MTLVGSDVMDEDDHLSSNIPGGLSGGSGPADAPDKGVPGGSNGSPQGEGEAWTILARLLSGPALYGGLGWFLDHLLGTGFLLPVGIVGGMALAIYVIAVRYRTR